MSEYVPTTQQIRDSYRSHDTLQAAAAAFSWEQRGDEFDRWLAAHDERVRAEERERCAQIAEDAYFGGGAAGSTHRWAAKQVAAAIRAVSAEQEGHRG